MPRVLHVITDLAPGGAELFLSRLAPRLRDRSIACAVCALGTGGAVAELLEQGGVTVTCCGMARGRVSLSGLARLRRVIREFHPDIVQTWLYHADLLGLGARLCGVRHVVWNLRCSDMRLEHYRRSTRLVVAACAKLSFLPDLVVVNSQAGREHHRTLGYRPKKWVVIPNGVDTELFRPSNEARSAVRQELGVADNDILVGVPARFDPMKGYSVLARAAGIALEREPNLWFVLYGQDMDRGNAPLLEMLRQAGALERTHLLGRREDAQRVHASLDMGCSSSLWGEGFSNALAEVMACGAPCVATDVGGNVDILGDTGHIVPPNDPETLAQGILDLARMPGQVRGDLGARARERILEYLSLEQAVERYAELYLTK